MSLQTLQRCSFHRPEHDVRRSDELLMSEMIMEEMALDSYEMS